MGKDAPAGCKFDKGLTALRKTLTVAGKATPPRDQPKVRSMTQPHDPLMRFSGSGCLPWCSPLVIYEYDRRLTAEEALDRPIFAESSGSINGTKSRLSAI